MIHLSSPPNLTTILLPKGRILNFWKKILSSYKWHLTENSFQQGNGIIY